VGKGVQDASKAAASSVLFRAGEPAPEFAPDPELETRFGLAVAVSPEPSA
jgi:hypothetical protein